MKAQHVEKVTEVLKLADKLGWIGKRIKGQSYPPMQLSEVEKCMLAMVDDFELERMRQWVKEIVVPEESEKEGK